MRGHWAGLAVAAATAMAAGGCGEGRAIFNVDVYSFLQAAQREAVPYGAPLPPGVPDTIPALQVNLVPGLSSSVVESVFVTATVDFENSTGTGTVGLEVYLDSLASGVYVGPPAFSLGGAVSGSAITRDTVGIDLPSFLALFTRSTMFLGLRTVSTATSPPVAGTARFTGLRLRIVVQEEVL